MSTTNYTPDVGLKGTYVLLSPLDVLVSPSVLYTCKALRKISELIGFGVNVYEDFYKAHGLDENIYDDDVRIDRTIITIVSDGGETINFPAGYLESYPNVNGQPYEIVNLQIHLPPFPRGTDLSYLYPQIQELIQMNLGVPEVVVAPVVASELQVVSKESHEAMMARRAMVRQIPTPTVRVQQLLAENDQLRRDKEELLSFFPLPSGATP